MRGTDALVEPMSPDDVVAVAALVRSTFEPRLWPFMTYTQSGSAEFMAVPARYPSVFPHLRSFVIKDGEAVLAFASFQLSAPHDGFLSYICVDPRNRGMGLASKLIAHFLELEDDVANLRLDVFADNGAALALYTKLGFVTESTSAWISRPMPEAAPSVPITGLATSLAVAATYGFCEVSVAATGGARTYRVLGADVVRCPDAASFDDDAPLSSIRSVFDASLAFAVIGEDELQQVASGYDIILQSQRMVLETGKAEEAT